MDVSQRPDFQRPEFGYPDSALRERAPAERPVGEIVTDLWHNTEKLVRQEMQLGLTEIDERVTHLKQEVDDRLAQLKRELILKAVGGVLLLGGYLAMVAALILVLAKAIDPWLSAFLVGAVLVGAGYLFEHRFKSKDDPDSRSVGNKMMDRGHALKEAMK